MSQQDAIQSIVKGSAPGWSYKATRPHMYGNKLRSSQQDSQNMKEEEPASDLESIKIKDPVGKHDFINSKHNLINSNASNYLISIKSNPKSIQN